MQNKNQKSKKRIHVYRQTKDHNGQTGRGRKVCKFYRELDSILGHRPASVPAVLLDTGTTNSSSSTENLQGDNSTYCFDLFSSFSILKEEKRSKQIVIKYRNNVTLMSYIHSLFINRRR